MAGAPPQRPAEFQLVGHADSENFDYGFVEGDHKENFKMAIRNVQRQMLELRVTLQQISNNSQEIRREGQRVERVLDTAAGMASEVAEEQYREAENADGDDEDASTEDSAENA